MNPDDVDLSELEPAVEAWIEGDIDGQTAGELQDLLARANCDAPDAVTGERDAALVELADRFRGFLAFGTAGLRGRLGGGPNRMNRAVVAKTAAGIASFISRQVPDGHVPHVVIGYDARRLSADFALDSAAVFTAAGAHVTLIDGYVPTPILAFAVRHLEADVGVMVTASHNPPHDNGYKVYLGGKITDDVARGVQIVAPTDAEIAAEIAQTPPANQIPQAAEGWDLIDEEIIDAYLKETSVAVRQSVGNMESSTKTTDSLRIVYTPLHGVGGSMTLQALADAGFDDVHVVDEQVYPDPDFPTVAFPNPEEPGALDLALQLAEDVNADLVIAQDPDADRCAIAVRDDATGRIRKLNGDEVGSVLAHVIAQGEHEEQAVLASSIVSSRLISHIANAHGLRHQLTLTGFKWIARVPHLAYGYEEALGYCLTPRVVADKDGIATAIFAARVARALKDRGQSFTSVLNDVYREHGYFATEQLSARFVNTSAIDDRIANFLASPPTELLGQPVTEVIDLATGLNDLPPTAGVWITTNANTRVVIRPSGTEPKLKSYLEIVQPVSPNASDQTLQTVFEESRTKLATLKSELARALNLY